MLKKKIYETSFDETEFIAVTAYQNDEVCTFHFTHRIKPKNVNVFRLRA